MSVFDRYKAPSGAYSFLQWKGTDACMDFTCECGNSEHFDGAFIYAIKCAVCGATWGLNPFIRCERLTDEEAREADATTVIAEGEDDD